MRGGRVPGQAGFDRLQEPAAGPDELLGHRGADQGRPPVRAGHGLRRPPKEWRDPADRPRRRGMGLLHLPARPGERLPPQFGREHLAGPVGQVVRLVDQEGIGGGRRLEEPPQVDPRIEGVVVVPDDHVGPQRDEQGKLERADPKRPRRLLDRRPVQPVPLEDRLQGRPHPVEMPPRVCAGLGPAVGLRQEADLLFGGQRQHFAPQAAFRQPRQRRLGHPAAHRLGGQVEDLRHDASPQGLQRGKQGGHCLADAGRRLREQPPAVGQGPPDGDRQRPLALAVAGEGEGQARDRGIAHPLPVTDGARPGQVVRHQVVEEPFQVIAGEGLPELEHFERVKVQVGQLHTDALEPVLGGPDEGVRLGLTPVDRLALPRDRGQRPGGRLDLVEGDPVGFAPDPVDPAADLERQVRRLMEPGHPHLGFVGRRPSLLDALVALGAGQGPPRPQEGRPQVAALQNEFHQVAHRHPDRDGRSACGRLQSSPRRGAAWTPGFVGHG